MTGGFVKLPTMKRENLQLQEWWPWLFKGSDQMLLILVPPPPDSMSLSQVIIHRRPDPYLWPLFSSHIDWHRGLLASELCRIQEGLREVLCAHRTIDQGHDITCPPYINQVHNLWEGQGLPWPCARRWPLLCLWVRDCRQRRQWHQSRCPFQSRWITVFSSYKGDSITRWPVSGWLAPSIDSPDGTQHQLLLQSWC